MCLLSCPCKNCSFFTLCTSHCCFTPLDCSQYVLPGFSPIQHAHINANLSTGDAAVLQAQQKRIVHLEGKLRETRMQLDESDSIQTEALQRHSEMQQELENNAGGLFSLLCISTLNPTSFQATTTNHCVTWCKGSVLLTDSTYSGWCSRLQDALSGAAGKGGGDSKVDSGHPSVVWQIKGQKYKAPYLLFQAVVVTRQGRQLCCCFWNLH